MVPGQVLTLAGAGALEEGDPAFAPRSRDPVRRSCPRKRTAILVTDDWETSSALRDHWKARRRRHGRGVRSDGRPPEPARRAEGAAAGDGREPDAQAALHSGSQGGLGA